MMFNNFFSMRGSIAASVFALNLFSGLELHAVKGELEEQPVSMVKSYSHNLSDMLQKQLVATGRDILGKLNRCEELDFSDDQTGLYSQLEIEAVKPQIFYNTLSRLDAVATVRAAITESTEDAVIRRNYMVAIASVIWALTDQAYQQGDIFQRGSITLVDPDHKLGEFLYNYVRLVTGSEHIEGLKHFGTMQNYAYPRSADTKLSSHHKGRTPLGQFGIDMRTAQSESPLNLLPFDRSHLLFGKLVLSDEQDQDLTFIKVEPVGLGNTVEKIGHTINFVERNQDKGKARKEKRTPKSIIKAFGPIQKVANVKKMPKTILEMQKIITEKAINDIELVKPFKSAIETKFAGDKARGVLQYRIGNEVIIKLNDSQKPPLGDPQKYTQQQRRTFTNTFNRLIGLSLPHPTKEMVEGREEEVSRGQITLGDKLWNFQLRTYYPKRARGYLGSKAIPVVTGVSELRTDLGTPAYYKAQWHYIDPKSSEASKHGLYQKSGTNTSYEFVLRTEAGVMLNAYKFGFLTLWD